jgi:hypothetical protein
MVLQQIILAWSLVIPHVHCESALLESVIGSVLEWERVEKE